MTDIVVLPSTWYGNRELTYTPKHFVVSNTPLTIESKLWIMNKLVGRYSVIKYSDTTDLGVFANLVSTFSDGFGRPAFEDPRELVFYELTWS